MFIFQISILNIWTSAPVGIALPGLNVHCHRQPNEGDGDVPANGVLSVSLSRVA